MRSLRNSILGVSLFAMGASSFAADQPAIRQVSSEGIRHSILICGRLTQLINEKSEVVWQVNEHSRDGSVLPNGNILFSANNVAKEMTRDMKVVWRYALAKPNKELGTASAPGQRQHARRRAGAEAAPARDHQGRQSRRRGAAQAGDGQRPHADAHGAQVAQRQLSSCRICWRSK